MSVLDDSIAVLLGLSRDLLSLSDSNILNEAALLLLLEEPQVDFWS